MLVRTDRLTEECIIIRNDLNKIRGRLTESESKISSTEDLTATHTNTIADMQRTIQLLVAKSDDTENSKAQQRPRLWSPEG